jgi:hypothetical protein
MKNKIIIGILLSCFVSFSSCEYSWDINETVYITNETEDSIRVAISNDNIYFNNDYSHDLYFVEPNIVSNKLTEIKSFFLGSKVIKENTNKGVVIGFLIYHIRDSTSIFLYNGYPDDEKFYKYVTTTCDVDNNERIITARTEIFVTEELLKEMTKDTALTDSIFGLK